MHAELTAELLVRKQTDVAPQLVDREDLPRDLALLTDQLIERDPKDRPDAETIAKAISLDLQTTSRGSRASTDEEVNAYDISVEEQELVLIGRDEQLGQLEAAKQEFLKKREPMVVWITGKSGEGKSALAEKFLRPLRLGKEMLVLSGRCYDRESVPFKVIDGLIDPLVQFLRSRQLSDVEALLPTGVEALAHLFPILRRVDAISDRGQQNLSGLDDRQIRNLAFAAFKSLLSSISRSTPIVMFVDDLQWGDPDSAAVLSGLPTPPDPPLVIFLGSFRSDEMEDSSFLREWKERMECNQHAFKEQEVRVAALSEEECLQFVQQRLARSGIELTQNVDEMFQGSMGNPYFLEQLIEGYDSQTGKLNFVSLSEIIRNRPW